MGLLSAWIAMQRGRSPIEGLILGGLFGPLGVIVECLLPVPERRSKAKVDRHAHTTSQAVPAPSQAEDDHPAVVEFLMDDSHNRERKISRRP